MWCEIFKTGLQKDNKGRKRNWTIADLDKMVQSYDPAHFHEAPIVIDHNEKNGPVKGGPAYGWVEALKRVGSSLYAKFRQVVPEFRELVNKGMFKKRSIGIRTDGTLQHVSFLGAVPPAVKGLEDFQFNQETDCFCYSEDGPINFNEEEPESMDEITRLKQELEAKEKALTDLKGELEQKDTELKGSSQEFSEFRKKALRQTYEAEFDKAVSEKKALPAWKDKGIIEFMMNLDETETYEFSESKKETQLEWFKNFISSLGEHQLFSEFATNNKAKQQDTQEFSEENLVDAIVAAANGGENA